METSNVVEGGVDWMKEDRELKIRKEKKIISFVCVWVCMRDGESERKRGVRKFDVL